MDYSTNSTNNAQLCLLVEVENASLEVLHLSQHQGVVEVVHGVGPLEELQSSQLLCHALGGGTGADLTKVQLQESVVDHLWQQRVHLRAGRGGDTL